MAKLVEQLPSGVAVYQVTDHPAVKCNIYCERPYCSADSRSFLYARQADDDSGGWDYLLCDFESWEERVVARGAMNASVSYNNDYYFVRSAGAKAKEMACIDLGTGDVAAVFAFRDGLGHAGHPGISRSGRYIAFGVALSYDPQRFGVELADVETGERRLICEDPFICNTHLQFGAFDDRTLMVQHNRGCEFTPAGERLRLVGDEGATLFLLDIEDGAITRLPLGTPHTTPVTGHEAWVGETSEMILTVAASGDFAPERGNILCLRAGEDCRQIGAGRRMCHIGTTHCGRYFCADGNNPQEVIIGSPATGKSVFVCDPRSTYGRGYGQCSHPHAYLSPDFRWVVFNSDVTGRPEIYAAAIPEALLAGLDDD